MVYRFDDSHGFARSLRDGEQELPLAGSECVDDGEWVLAIFEVGVGGEKKRATAAAARGCSRGAGAGCVLTFERRDWERLVDFAEAGSATMRAARGLANSPQTSGSATSGRVLVVDDDRDIREVVGAMLDSVGLEVQTATCAEEALERVHREAYDLLVLDWNLPGMTGIELCRTVRKDARLRAIPVLFLTAHASSSDVVEAFASGADDYVVKPFRAPELGARIFGLLRRSRMTHPAL